MTRTAESAAPAPGEVLPPPRRPEPGGRSVLSRVRDGIFRYGLREAKYSLAAAVGLFKSLIGCGLVFLSNWMAKRYANYQIF